MIIAWHGHFEVDLVVFFLCGNLFRCKTLMVHVTFTTTAESHDVMSKICLDLSYTEVLGDP